MSATLDAISHFPRHVALIPDGNRTRARQNSVDLAEAYRKSFARGLELTEFLFSRTPVETFTLRGLSTENAAKRSDEEINFLMTMYRSVDDDFDEILRKNQINFHRVGNPSRITPDFLDYLESKKSQHRYDSPKTLIFALNYGGRDEILRGVQKFFKKFLRELPGNLSPAEITKNLKTLSEKKFSEFLDFADFPTIDLVIRTKGEQARRTSGFLSRRIGYAELFFSPKLCPDFAPADLTEALARFSEIQTARNFGA